VRQYGLFRYFNKSASVFERPSPGAGQGRPSKCQDQREEAGSTARTNPALRPFERLEDPGARLPKRWELGSEQSTEPPNGAPKSAARDFRTPTQLRSLPDDALHITLLAAVNGDRAVSTGVTRVPKSPMIGVRRCLDLNGRKVSFGAFGKQVFLEGFQSEPLPEPFGPTKGR
jgi:hypothetical protein